MFITNRNTINGGLYGIGFSGVLYIIRGYFDPNVFNNWDMGIEGRKSAGILLFFFLYFYWVGFYVVSYFYTV